MCYYLHFLSSCELLLIIIITFYYYVQLLGYEAYGMKHMYNFLYVYYYITVTNKIIYNICT